VAEHLMKAIKLSSSPDEKKQFKAQCHEIMDVATRIKNHPDWRPEGGAPQPARTKHEQIGQWAAEVAVEGSLPESVSASGFEDISSHSGTTAPVDNVSAASGELSLASFNIATTSERAYESRPHETRIAMRDTSTLLIDLSDDHPAPSDLKTMGPTDAQHEASPKAGSTNVAAPHVLSVTVDKVLSLEPELRQSQRRAAKGDSGPTTPSMASSSKIRRLAEPVSTRKRSNKEEIILLKASLVNGFKCPPWDKNPSAAEFVAQKGAELFTDTHDLSLSSYQQQFFQGWARAGQAIPPSSTFSGDRSGITPLMSSSRTIDLVQDAASDCSVVTSLCAGLARAERGHDQVSEVTLLDTMSIGLTRVDAYEQAVSLRQAAWQACSLDKRQIHCATELQWLLEEGSD
jgi:calpain-7